MKVVPGIDITNGHILSTNLLEPHLASHQVMFPTGVVISDTPHPTKVLLWSSTVAHAVGDLRYVLGGVWRVYQCRVAVPANTETRPDRDPESWDYAGPYEVVWAPAARSVGDRVIRRSTHRTYFALRDIAAGETTPPEDDPTTWQDIGPTNAWAMFDKLRSSQSIDAKGTTYETGVGIPGAPLEDGVIEVQIKPKKRIDAILLGGLDGTSVYVRVVHVDPTTYAITPLVEKTIKLARRTVRGWKDYFFSQFKPRRAIALFDLPLRADAYITVRVTNTSGPAKCGALLVDRSTWIGDFEYGAVTDAENYSVIERDAYGTAILDPYRTVPRVSGTLWAPSNLSDTYMELRETLNARPAGFVGLEAYPNHPYHDSLFVIGLLRRLADAKTGPYHEKCEIEIEEL